MSAFPNVLEELPSDPDVSDHDVFIQQSQFVRDLPEPPAILLMGSSRTESAFVPEQMARALGLPEKSVVSLTIGAGGPWDALVTLRRNPKLLETARLAVLDVEPWQLNENFDGALPNRFYWGATLRERVDAPAGVRGRALLDWVWPYIAQRRDLSLWCSGVKNLLLRGSTTSTELSQATPENLYWQVCANEEKRQRVRANPRYTPDGFAQRTFRDFAYSRRCESALLELLHILEEYNIHVVLHQPPMATGFFDWLDRHQEARAPYESYLHFVGSLQSDRVRVWVWEGPQTIGLTNEDLLDYGHFSLRAAELYTERVCQRIRSEGCWQASVR